jgi:hypothetical protein
LSFLPTELQTALNDLGDFIDAKLARLKQGSVNETERFRQALLKWCKQKFIPYDLLEGTHVTPKKLKVTFRIQKNRENGQSITLVADDMNHHICPVHTAHRISNLPARKAHRSI